MRREFGSCGWTLFTWMTGQIVQHYSYDVIFVIMAFMHPVAGAGSGKARAVVDSGFRGS